MKHFILSAIMLLVLSACSGVDVQTQVRSGSDTAKFATYSWLEIGDTSLTGVRMHRPDVDAWVKASVDRQLLAKGYTKVSGRQPDMIVSWVGAIEQKVKVESINHFYSSYGYGPVAASMLPGTKDDGKRREYEEGTILLNILDPESHTIFWRGRGTDLLLPDLDNDEVALYIGRLVKSILKTFPAAKK
ncbi:MAG: hypothetical protein COA36_11365 [Desulfotalea sp.]|nr:MAG: hypothetical protein COA36_11365 [Desulfotalea sp.]